MEHTNKATEKNSKKSFFNFGKFFGKNSSKNSKTIETNLKSNEFANNDISSGFETRDSKNNDQLRVGPGYDAQYNSKNSSQSKDRFHIIHRNVQQINRTVPFSEPIQHDFGFSNFSAFNNFDENFNRTSDFNSNSFLNSFDNHPDQLRPNTNVDFYIQKINSIDSKRIGPCSSSTFNYNTGRSSSSHQKNFN